MSTTKKKAARKPSGKQCYEEAVIKIADELPHLTEAISDLTGVLGTFLELAKEEFSKEHSGEL